MSQGELVDLSPPFDPNNYSEPCFTCTKVFFQPKKARFAPFYPFDVEGGEILASAQANCQWCKILCAEILLQDECRGMSESSLNGLNATFQYYTTAQSGLNILNIQLFEPHRPQDFPLCDIEFVMVGIPERYHIDSSTSGYTFPQETSSPSCRMLASGWIDNCMQNHSKCSADKIQWLPARLVDVGLDDGVIKLVETEQLSKDHYSPYFALSHKWGATSDQSIRLLSRNRLALMEHIPIDQFTASLQDAIQFTRDMKVSYIWIDSVCIIQDSLEDWNAEAAVMDKVYSQSLCVIAASYASSIEGSPNKRLFYTRTLNDITSWLPVHKLFAAHDQTNDRETFYKLSPKSSLIANTLSHFPLYKRGWVLQEQILSPRTIHFGKQLVWECKEQRASETFPTGIPFIPENNKWLERRSHHLWGGKDFESKDWKSGLQAFKHKFWHDTLDRYLSCSLTYPSDRLVAIGAIAREYQKQLDDVYLAGLWKKELPGCLLWAFNRGSSFPTRAKPYRCPTWSWASLDFSDPVSFGKGFFGSSCLDLGFALARVIAAEVASPQGRTYTEYYAGYIRLEGRIYPIGREDAREWLRVDGDGIFLGDASIPRDVKSYLDIEVHEDDYSNLCLFPIAALCLDDYVPTSLGGVTSIVECLILRTVSVGSGEFERVGIVSFKGRYGPECQKQPGSIMNFAFANDPFSEILDTITIL